VACYALSSLWNKGYRSGQWFELRTESYKSKKRTLPLWQHKVCKDTSARGETSVGWLYGYKLHLVVSERGDLLNTTLTSGNTDDRKSVVGLLSVLSGKVFANRGDVLKKLAKQLLEAFNIGFFDKPWRNMQDTLMRLLDNPLARKRSIVETVIDQLKNIS